MITKKYTLDLNDCDTCERLREENELLRTKINAMHGSLEYSQLRAENAMLNTNLKMTTRDLKDSCDTCESLRNQNERLRSALIDAQVEVCDRVRDVNQLRAERDAALKEAVRIGMEMGRASGSQEISL